MTKRGLIIRVIYLCISLAWYLLTGFGRRYRTSAVVLCYHGVTAANKKAFARQIELIHDCIRPVGVLPPASSAGKEPFVWVTFDDAFANLLENALPVFFGAQGRPMIFAVPESFGRTPSWNMPSSHPDRRERVMTREEFASGVRAGFFCAGSHTLTHPCLPKLDRICIEKEALESKLRLETLIKGSVQDLALPYGANTVEVAEIVLRAGYARVFTLEPRVVTSTEEKVIGRFGMTPDAWPAEFILTCRGAYAWLYGVRRLLRSVRQKCRRP